MKTAEQLEKSIKWHGKIILDGQITEKIRVAQSGSWNSRKRQSNNRNISASEKARKWYARTDGAMQLEIGEVRQTKNRDSRRIATIKQVKKKKKPTFLTVTFFRLSHLLHCSTFSYCFVCHTSVFHTRVV